MIAKNMKVKQRVKKENRLKMEKAPIKASNSTKRMKSKKVRREETLRMVKERQIFLR